MKHCQGVLILVLAVFRWAAEAAAVTPVEKVIELLSKLELQIQDEGKAEAAEYDKYACFCKEEVDNKLYAIEKSTAKIAKLDAEITQLGADIQELAGHIQKLSQDIDGLTTEMATAKQTRDGEHAAFLLDLADVDGAISACERALQALKESKASLGGKTELEAAALAQIKVVAATVLRTSAAAALPASQLQRLVSLAAVQQPGKAYESSYHSNDIVATLEALQQKFESRKAAIEQEEFDTNSAFEKRQLGLSNEKKFAEKDKVEREQLFAEKSEAKAATEADRLQENSEMTADKNFMDVLTGECETKAQLWDQRSKTRADELRAISEASQALKDGVAPNFQANKKLVGLQESVSSMPKGHWVYVEEPTPKAAKAASFLQLRRGLRGSGRSRSLSKSISDVLFQAAKKLKSPILSAAALKVSVSEDHFVKVRQIIKDLVQQLQAEADSERTQKSFCDEAMQKAVQSRDEEQGKVEDLKAQITSKEAEKAQLQADIATLSEEIASNRKALMEATELREKENLENTLTIAEAGAGKEAVEQAIQVLKAFYEGQSFAQFVPTNSDREGKTVADKAPQVFDSEYHGSQEASKGIVGLLEVILSDFDRTVTTVTQEESDAVAAFTTFKDENEADTKTKEEAVTTKEGQVVAIEDELVGLTDNLHSATTNHELALEELEKLNSMCVAGEETYEERVAKRKQEIEALKQAHDILENWQQ